MTTTVYDRLSEAGLLSKLLDVAQARAKVDNTFRADIKQEILMAWIARPANLDMSIGETASYALIAATHAVRSYLNSMSKPVKLANSAFRVSPKTQAIRIHGMAFSAVDIDEEPHSAFSIDSVFGDDFDIDGSKTDLLLKVLTGANLKFFKALISGQSVSSLKYCNSYVRNLAQACRKEYLSATVADAAGIE